MKIINHQKSECKLKFTGKTKTAMTRGLEINATRSKYHYI